MEDLLKALWRLFAAAIATAIGALATSFSYNLLTGAL
jgi:hypothetical protein